ncbi:MAG: fumarylacetoacetate hydrolase family protein [Bdellovibrionaceae bacterium]|nr:fumarylacetoacetate hydrolase family protein [Pseudobdellovibrionaceae bacterium]
MKLGSLKSNSSRDGELIVVSKNNKIAVKVPDIAPNLRVAIENWEQSYPQLERTYLQLNKNEIAGAFDIDTEKLHSPLPRTFQWADGSAFIHHIKLVRMARNSPLPETLTTVPLMYQGGGDDFLAPTDDIPQIDFNHGTDFEGEVGVITGDVPMGISPQEALKYIRLFVLINDVSLRGLIPEELKQGFGFFHGKPSTAFAPFAVTADELNGAWKDGRIHLALNVKLNGEFFGNADAGQMHFHFGQLIAHAAKTRNLKAGCIIGSGTVSNEDMARGSSCLAEKRMLEQIHEGQVKTPFMKVGDVVEMEINTPDGKCIFGKIKQKVIKA